MTLIVRDPVVPIWREVLTDLAIVTALIWATEAVRLLLMAPVVALRWAVFGAILLKFLVWRAILQARALRPDLCAHPLLPDDTRLWAALQHASGGTWGGCVYDVNQIIAQLSMR